MNYKYAFIFLLAFVVVFASVKYVKQSTYVEKLFSKQTNIDFTNRTFDFGSIPSKKAAYTYFVFTNRGSNDLEIERVDTRCGCTVPDWTKTAIKPNQKDSILVKFDAEEEGFFLKEIYVLSNSETSPDLLSIKGTVASLSSHSR